MKISSPGSISGHKINDKECKYINNMNDNLLEIEKIFIVQMNQTIKQSLN